MVQPGKMVPSHWPLTMATVPELWQLSNAFSLFMLKTYTLAARRQREEKFASLNILCLEVGPSHNPNSYSRGFTKNRKSVSLPSLPYLTGIKYGSTYHSFASIMYLCAFKPLLMPFPLPGICFASHTDPLTPASFTLSTFQYRAHSTKAKLFP